MIKLPPIDKEIKNKFLKFVKPRFKKIIEDLQNESLHSNLTQFFYNGSKIDDNKIDEIIIGDLNNLLTAIKSIGTFTGTSYTSPQTEFIGLYNKFTNSVLGKSLCDDLGIKVCPYCNRSYIHTLKKNGVRPQYDHFFNKIKYPYLAVSLYNLIPSCSICNQAKSDTDTYDNSIGNNFLYPYTEEYGYDVCFKVEFNGDVSYLLGKNDNFHLNIINASSDINFQKKVQNTISILHTKELYEKHKDYVLDIIRACQIYNESYLYDIFQMFPTLFNDVSDVKRLVFMNYLDKEHWGDRVLAKLNYDIIQEFQIK